MYNEICKYIASFTDLLSAKSEKWAQHCLDLYWGGLNVVVLVLVQGF